MAAPTVPPPKNPKSDLPSKDSPKKTGSDTPVPKKLDGGIPLIKETTPDSPKKLSGGSSARAVASESDPKSARDGSPVNHPKRISERTTSRRGKPDALPNPVVVSSPTPRTPPVEEVSAPQPDLAALVKSLQSQLQREQTFRILLEDRLEQEILERKNFEQLVLEKFKLLEK